MTVLAVEAVGGGDILLVKGAGELFGEMMDNSVDYLLTERENLQDELDHTEELNERSKIGHEIDAVNSKIHKLQGIKDPPEPPTIIRENRNY